MVTVILFSVWLVPAQAATPLRSSPTPKVEQRSPQSSTQPYTQDPPTPSATVASGDVTVETSSDAAFRIGKGLRCPVCQGMPIAESPSPMAQAMMKHVREMVADGKNDDEVRAYFVERYGEWVLLAPPIAGFGLWAWALPPVALLCGIVFALWQVRRLRRGRTPSVAPPAAAQAGEASADAYLQAIRDEVRQ